MWDYITVGLDYMWKQITVNCNTLSMQMYKLLSSLESVTDLRLSVFTSAYIYENFFFSYSYLMVLIHITIQIILIWTEEKKKSKAKDRF